MSAQEPVEGLEFLLEVGEAIKASPCWSAEYRQEYLAPGMTLGDEVSGQVWIAWPDQALFEAGRPAQRTMGLDGRTVRLLDYEVLSCDEHTLTDDEWARVPLAAVLDPSRALERFSVLGLDERGFALEPYATEGVERVEVKLAKNGLPADVVIIDPQGATNRLVFTGWKRSKPPNGGWLPEPPDEIECAADLSSMSQR
ncbi:MAG: hypothetical protein GY906_34700 [bacterium]|nr:hypothetical protein [bacterium]